MKKFVLIFLFLGHTGWASELVYSPINPSFGGSPLNGNMLLGKAQAQNKFQAKRKTQSYAEKLQSSLERSYINRLVREITDTAFGENIESSLFGEDATFISGDFKVQLLTSNADALTVEIENLLTGEVTIIEIPRFGS